MAITSVCTEESLPSLKVSKISIRLTDSLSHPFKASYAIYYGPILVEIKKRVTINFQRMSKENAPTSLVLSLWSKFWKRIISSQLSGHIRYRLTGIKCIDGEDQRLSHPWLQFSQHPIIVGLTRIKELLSWLKMTRWTLSSIKMWINPLHFRII